MGSPSRKSHLEVAEFNYNVNSSQRSQQKEKYEAAIDRGPVGHCGQG